METTQQIGAHRVKVWEEGHGPPVVFFYDSWHTSHGFYAVSDHLSEKHRVLSMDPPGFGASPGASDLSLDLNDYAELFGEFVRYAGIRGVTLALCDLGLPIGLNFLAEGTDAVEHVERVVITNGLLYGEQAAGRGLFGQGMLLSGRELPIDRVHHRRRLLQFFGDPNTMDESIAEDAWYSFSKGRLNDQAKLAKTFDDLKSDLEGWRRSLGESGIPVLVLWGEEDPSGDRKLVEKFQEEVPQAEIYMLPDVGHFPHLEVPDVVADGIRDFVKRAQRGAPPREPEPAAEEETPDDASPSPEDQ